MFSADMIRQASFKDAKTMIKANITENKYWLARALLAIYQRQTADEQQAEATEEHNGMGFTGPDAHILTSFAQHYLRKASLSERQWQICLKMMIKYCGQLAKIAHEKKEIVP